MVSTVDIVRHPSEAEQVLRMLPGHLRGLKKLPPEAGMAALKAPHAALKRSFMAILRHQVVITENVCFLELRAWGKLW